MIYNITNTIGVCIAIALLAEEVGKRCLSRHNFELFIYIAIIAAICYSGLIILEMIKSIVVNNCLTKIFNKRLVLSYIALTCPRLMDFGKPPINEKYGSIVLIEMLVLMVIALLTKHLKLKALAELSHNDESIQLVVELVEEKLVENPEHTTRILRYRFKNPVFELFYEPFAVAKVVKEVKQS